MKTCYSLLCISITITTHINTTAQFRWDEYEYLLSKHSIRWPSNYLHHQYAQYSVFKQLPAKRQLTNSSKFGAVLTAYCLLNSFIFNTIFIFNRLLILYVFIKTSTKWHCKTTLKYIF